MLSPTGITRGLCISVKMCDLITSEKVGVVFFFLV